ncbi:protein kinase [Streptomyces sp. NPDC087440]|uniref:serine/threonine-protein kinase n=1 Tax=Streptomyces sp. NPDC087440 TaxID=3365790 RepID=UPI003801A4D4
MSRGERPAQLGHYEVDELLGAGGMGEVYLAHSPSGRAVAVKVIRPDLANTPGFRERFAREVQAARQVSGAFTAPLLDADTEADTPWMATQYVAGRTLAETVKEDGPLPADEVWRLASGLCEALRDIHRAGLVHRDFKPGNILLAEDGPRVIDFGISRVADTTALTQSGQVMGTPPFMAPEQFLDAKSADAPADVFALGSVLVYAATGHGPFDADTPYAIAWKAVHDAPDLTGLPATLLPVVEPCLTKSPPLRPTPETLLGLLSSRRERRTHRSAAREAARRCTRRRRAGLAAAALVTAGALAGVWAWGPWAHEGRPPAQGAETRKKAPAQAPVRLAGWKPWTSSVVQTDYRGPDSHLTCVYERSSLWCSGSGVLLTRLDPLTGRVLWQQKGSMSIAPDGPVLDGERVYVTGVAGAEEGVVHTWVFNAESGKLIDQGVVSGTEGCSLAEELLACRKDGRIRARSLQESRWMWSAAPGWEPYTVPFWSESSNNFLVRRTSGAGQVRLGEISRVDGRFTWTWDVPQGQNVRSVTGDHIYLEATTQGLATKVTRVDRRTGKAAIVELATPEEVLTVRGDVLYTRRYSGVITAYDMNKRARLWTAVLSGDFVSQPVVEGEYVLFTTDDAKVVALDRRNGGIRWQYRTPRPPQPVRRGRDDGHFSREAPMPIVLGDIVFAPITEFRVHSFLISQAEAAAQRSHS